MALLIHERLREAIHDEFGERPWVGALATVEVVDGNAQPRVRHIVIRRVDERGVWIVSDARSEKNAQLKANLNAELTIWLPRRREQFRVAGGMKILSADSNDPMRQTMWNQLTDASRALFVWPTPKASKDRDELFPAAVNAQVVPPESFEVLHLAPKRAEHLELNFHPHRRQLWDAAKPQEWRDVNP